MVSAVSRAGPGSGHGMTSLSGVGSASVIVHGHSAQQVITSSQQPSSTVGESVGSLSRAQNTWVMPGPGEAVPASNEMRVRMGSSKNVAAKSRSGQRIGMFTIMCQRRKV